MSTLQKLFFASDRHALLLVFQAMDAAGKDGVIRHVMSGVDPQGCKVVAFKPPSDDELHHDFLWRAACDLPGRGRIGIYNRSYYEEVLITRVHPDRLREEGQKARPALWRDRFRSIVDFERHLTADEEDKFIIAQANIHVHEDGTLTEELVSARHGERFLTVRAERVARREGVLGGRERALGGAAEIVAGLAEDRQQAVAEILQHLAALPLDRRHEAVEEHVEQANRLLGSHVGRGPGVVAHIGEQDRRADPCHLTPADVPR